MRTARNLQQNMWYSLQGGIVPVYETDAEGNIKYYTDAEGNKIPLDTGQTTIGYEIPVEMSASISFGSGEAEATEFGLNIADFDASIITAKDLYPLSLTSLIWYGEEPIFQDDDREMVNPKSATFKVVAIKPSLHYTKYLVKRIVK